MRTAATIIPPFGDVELLVGTRRRRRALTRRARTAAPGTTLSGPPRRRRPGAADRHHRGAHLAPRPVRGPWAATAARWGAATVLVVAGVALLAWTGHGGRVLVMSTASMGTTAPVGSLLVTAPEHGPVHVGEVVAFHSAPGGPIYAHRVVATLPGGRFRTKGDLNGGPDPWVVRPSEVVGPVVAIMADVGWLARSLPWMLLVALATTTVYLLLPPAHRRTAVVVGLGAAVIVPLQVLHPLVAVQLITATESYGHDIARVVPTGLLPLQLTMGAAHAAAAPGQAVVLRAPAASGTLLAVRGRAALTPAGWGAAAVVVLMPMLCAAGLLRWSGPAEA